eukprot:4960735-Heterocapsa_arctica.AAC.1
MRRRRRKRRRRNKKAEGDIILNIAETVVEAERRKNRCVVILLGFGLNKLNQLQVVPEPYTGISNGLGNSRIRVAQ